MPMRSGLLIQFPAYSNREFLKREQGSECSEQGFWTALHYYQSAPTEEPVSGRPAAFFSGVVKPSGLVILDSTLHPGGDRLKGHGKGQDEIGDQSDLP